VPELDADDRLFNNQRAGHEELAAAGSESFEKPAAAGSEGFEESAATGSEDFEVPGAVGGKVPR